MFDLFIYQYEYQADAHNTRFSYFCTSLHVAKEQKKGFNHILINFFLMLSMTNHLLNILCGKKMKHSHHNTFNHTKHILL